MTELSVTRNTPGTADLRAQFDAVAQATDNRFQNFQIRVHRALSWRDRALELDPESQPDGRLIYGWIAFNALYGSWDVATGMPARDIEGWRGFLDQMLKVDAAGRLAAELVRLKDDVLQLLENKYLDPKFWKNPAQPGNTRRRYFEAQSLYVEKRWALLLGHVFERIYVLRGQIVHGGATNGSRLNRATVGQCAQLLERFLPIVLELVIAHRADDQWPPLCYPPIDNEPAGPAGNGRSRPR